MSPDVDTQTSAAATPPGWTPPVASPPEPQKAPRKGLPDKVMAAIILTVTGVALLVAALVVTQLKLRDADAVTNARATALVAAKTFSVEISTYDYRHLDSDFGAVINASTGKFKTDFTKASKDLQPLITKYQATSSGNVSAAGVTDATSSDAIVVVFVDQTVKNSNSPTPRVDRNRLRLTLTHASSGWLVNKVEIL